jgi:hypothetical protein
MRERALGSIIEKLLRDPIAQFTAGFTSFGSRCGSFRKVRTLELMIARGFFEEIIVRRRGVVHRRPINAHDPLQRIQMVMGTKLQARNTICIDRDQMETTHRHVHGDLLDRPRVSAGQETHFATVF